MHCMYSTESPQNRFECCNDGYITQLVSSELELGLQRYITIFELIT